MVNVEVRRCIRGQSKDDGKFSKGKSLNKERARSMSTDVVPNWPMPIKILVAEFV